MRIEIRAGRFRAVIETGAPEEPAPGEEAPGAQIAGPLYEPLPYEECPAFYDYGEQDD